MVNRRDANRNGKQDAGFTLVEVSIILFVLVILSSILLVNLGDFNRLARFARVKEDVGALCAVLAQYITDTGESAFYEWGGRNNGGFDSDTPVRDTIGLLIGDGDIPTLNTHALDSRGDEWQARAGENFWMPLDITGESLRFDTDTFANHLIHNTPMGEPERGYRTPSDMLSGAHSAGISHGLLFDPEAGEGFNSLFAWRGPYINDRVDPDPWGNRYMANVFALFTPPGISSDGFGSAVVCYSAGPDEEIDTAFNQSGGWFTGDDDITALVSAGGSR